MTAASAPLKIDVVPAGSVQRFVLESGKTAYPNAWLAVISYNHASDSTKGGQVTPFTGATGEIPVGRNISPSGNEPDYATTASVRAGATVGDGSKTVGVLTAGRFVKHVLVTGVTALTDAGKLVYLDDDATLSITGGSGILGVPVGYIVKLEDVTTTACTVYEFGFDAIYQNVLNATIIP